MNDTQKTTEIRNVIYDLHAKSKFFIFFNKCQGYLQSHEVMTVEECFFFLEHNIFVDYLKYYLFAKSM